MFSTWIALGGGVLIGVASALLFLTHGRIAGISGILGSLLQGTRDRAWRVAFVGGMVAAGIVASFVAPAAVGTSVRALPLLIVAGVLVGYGTRMGGGCTSGHGVCGLSRLSPRSLVATLVFMGAGFATVFVVRHLLGI